jgi:hypothetical protein
VQTVAQLSAYDFYCKLMNLTVPGYQGYPGGLVSVSTYLSANPSFGGNGKAAILRAALQGLAKAPEDVLLTRSAGFGRVFTGQGSRDDMVAAMQLVGRSQDKLKANRDLAGFFSQKDFLQAMVDGKCFGLDCIGFVGTYLVDAGLEDAYTGRRPLDFADVFPPVKSLDEVKDLSVVMLTNGLHVQMIDTVNERGDGYIKVDLCQSSSGGPQCNCGVTIRSGGGDYLPVEEFRQALADKRYAADHADDNAARQRAGQQPRDYETYLRARLKRPNTASGYRGGSIFQLHADGDPKNPVGGSVYVGVARGGLSVADS